MRVSGLSGYRMLLHEAVTSAWWSCIRLALRPTGSAVKIAQNEFEFKKKKLHSYNKMTKTYLNLPILCSISLNTMTLQVESPCVYTSQGVPISVTGIAQVKIQGQNEDMLLTACEQFLGKTENEIQHIALVTLEGHQRAIMGSMTVEEIYKDRKKFSKQVFEVASSDLVNMGITVVSYTIKDIRDEEVCMRDA